MVPVVVVVVNIIMSTILIISINLTFNIKRHHFSFVVVLARADALS